MPPHQRSPPHLRLPSPQPRPWLGSPWLASACSTCSSRLHCPVACLGPPADTGSPQLKGPPATCSSATLHPSLWSGSFGRSSSHRGAPSHPLLWAALSEMAPVGTQAITDPEPSCCGWAVHWVPARCRTSVTVCGSCLGQLALGTQSPWTPAVPTAMAEQGQAHACLSLQPGCCTSTPELQPSPQSWPCPPELLQMAET